MSQGSVGAPVVFSITAKNGFSGQVQIALAGLPAGVVSNPPSPFMAASGADAQVVFGAAGNAATGNFAVSAQGVLGAPFLQGNAGGDNVVFAFGSNSGGRIAVWNSSSPDQFTVSGANAAVSDIASTVDRCLPCRATARPKFTIPACL